ncbi:MAG: RHS repeat-associated core domain-containing protein, partial [Bacteroidetes bacterium]|nr:RHS repeat-associated core domain-containing protein [Bacteroidota bacterium]
YDYGARFYDPALGRFHSLDPIAPFIPGITPYNYAFNNPINLVDFEGLYGDSHDPKKRDRQHRRKTILRNIKNKVLDVLSISHDSMANVSRQKKNAGKTSSNSSSGKSNTSSPNIKADIDYTGLNFGDFGLSNDIIKPLNIPPTSGGYSSSLIIWNDELVDVTSDPVLELSNKLFVGDTDFIIERSLSAEINNLYSIADYLTANPDYAVTIIITSPLLIGKVGDMFVTQEQKDASGVIVKNRAAKIASLISSFSSVKVNQIVSSVKGGNEMKVELKVQKR